MEYWKAVRTCTWQFWWQGFWVWALAFEWPLMSVKHVRKCSSKISPCGWGSHPQVLQWIYFYNDPKALSHAISTFLIDIHLTSPWRAQSVCPCHHQKHPNIVWRHKLDVAFGILKFSLRCDRRVEYKLTWERRATRSVLSQIWKQINSTCRFYGKRSCTVYCV